MCGLNETGQISENKFIAIDHDMYYLFEKISDDAEDKSIGVKEEKKEKKVCSWCGGNGRAYQTINEGTPWEYTEMYTCLHCDGTGVEPEH